jgi:Leucine-rich repeat (LRR) protein
MKKLFFIISFWLPFMIYSQTLPSLDFVIGVEGGSSEQKVAVDFNNNKFVAGHFTGNVDFDPSSNTANLTDGGAFVAKYDVNGDFLWVFKIENVSYGYGFDIKVDNEGNFLLVGAFYNTIDLDLSSNVVALTPNNDSQDIFVAKYTNNGEYLWGFSIGGSSIDGWTNFDIDNSNNIVVIGRTNGEVDFDPSSNVESLSSDLVDIFVAKYDGNGSYLWAFNLPNTTNDNAANISVDNEENIILTGSWSGNNTVDFDPSSNVLNLTGSNKSFLCKYDGLGNFIWAFLLEENGTDISLDNNNDILISGYNLSDRFVSKYSADGIQAWTFTLSDAGGYYSNPITVDSDNNLFLTGSFNGLTDFDPSSNETILTSDLNYVFVAKYDANGNLLNVFDVGFGYGTDITYDEGLLTIVGSYNGLMDFDPSSNNNGFNGSGTFLANYIDCNCNPENDRNALIALYNATNGDNWTNNTNWNTNEPISSWYNVWVNSEGCVENLTLINNQLNGTLPIELGNLKNLKYLSLYGNQINSVIPNSLYNLPKLEYFNLYSNQISGEISSKIGNLINLEHLYLGENQLSGSIPTEIGNLTKLKGLGLGANDFIGNIPTEIGNLIELDHLQLFDNNFNGIIPSTIGNLNKLQSLYFSGNLQLTGSIPQSFLNLSSLNYFTFFNTNICIPQEADFQNWLSSIIIESNENPCTSETILYLSNPTSTNITQSSAILGGEITNDGGANILERGVVWSTSTNNLYIENNAVVKIISQGTSLGTFNTNVTNLPTNTIVYFRAYAINNLGISYSEISGFSTSESYTCNLENEKATLLILFEATNGQNWTNNTNWNSDKPLSEWYGVKTNTDGCVVGLELYNNNLNGSIPLEIIQLENLEYFDVTSNSISGNIPYTIGGIQNLEVLYLAENQLTGKIPETVGNLLNLRKLHLDNNQLSGVIPNSIGNLVNIEEIWMYGNSLSGDLPYEIGNLAKLKDFSIQHNLFTGQIPASIGNLTDLQKIVLSFNNFQGVIPNSIGNLSELQYLWLSGNNFSGSLPTEIGNLTKLKHLILSNNLQLNDRIPTSFTSLINLTSFHFGYTNICIPQITEFLTWFNSIPSLVSNYIYCNNELTLILENPTSTSITQNSAILGGEITSDGDAEITERGIVWATTSNPTIGDEGVTKVVASGTSIGVFSTNVSSLPVNTTIYYRAYATNSAGTSYTENMSFKTLVETIVLQLDSKNSNSISISWNNVSGELGYQIERSENVDFSNSTVFEVGENITQYNDSNLEANTTYYYRVRAILEN